MGNYSARKCRLYNGKHLRHYIPGLPLLDLKASSSNKLYTLPIHDDHF
jgi:hypothetical protein